MADKKDPSQSKGAANPGASGSTGRKPTPILDLKAKEVSGGSKAPEKTVSPTSNLKGAPDWKPAGSDKQSSAGGSDAGSSAKNPAAEKADLKAAAGTTASKSAPPSGSKTSAKPGQASSANGPSGADRPRSQTAGRSGGGFLSVVSHMVAGIVGGAIALFAAEPVGQQFGLTLAKAPAVPPGFEARIQALEAKQGNLAQNFASKSDVSAVADELAGAQSRLAALDKLGKDVTTLASDFAKLRDQQASPASTSENAAKPADAAGDSREGEALRQRLAKLESQLATLVTATSKPDGAGAGIAPIADFSAKFADLEGTLNRQLSELRASMLSEMENKVSTSTDRSAKAVAGAERLDREVAAIKTDTARLEQRAEVLKTASDKLDATLRAVSKQAAELKVELDGLKGDVTEQLGQVARPADVAKAIAPVSAKVAAIENNLSGVLASEAARKQNAERIVLSLELANLKRVLDRGAPYASELADVKKVAGGLIKFDGLEAYKEKGVPSARDITREFRDVAYAIINAEETVPAKDGSVVDRLLAGARSIVRVRRTDVPQEAKTAEAAVARIDGRLREGDMNGALTLAEELPGKLKKPAEGWLAKLSARAGVDRAIAEIESQLKASLGAGQASEQKG